MPTKSGHQVVSPQHGGDTPSPGDRPAPTRRRTGRPGRTAATLLTAALALGAIGASSLLSGGPGDAARAAAGAATRELSALAGAPAAPLDATTAQLRAVAPLSHPQTDPADAARSSFPREVVPAESIDALIVAPAAPAQARVAAPAPRALLSPAAAARLAEQTRASRAAARATLGAKPGFARPVEGTHFTSGYKQRWGRLHAGLDFAGPIGQVVRAVAPGTVTVAGPASGYGRLVEIRHADGRFTRYGHLHRVDVKVGQQVEAAEPIAALGNAGRSTGPHLHFEVRTPAGTPVDPMPWLEQRGIVPVETPPATHARKG